MKRKLIAFSMTMALLLSAISAASVGAHSAPVEFTPTTPLAVPSRAEWFGQQSDQAGEAIIQRNAGQQGELIYNDVGKDQRLISVPPLQASEKITREVDLDWFGVTADADNLYFLAKPDIYNGIKNDPSIELIITIDTNQTNAGALPIPLGVGNTFATTNVPADAAWEFAVDTTFRPGSPAGVNPYVNGTTQIWNTATTSTLCATCLAQLASAALPSGSFAEIAIPWTQIGNKPTGANYLRFTASIMYSPSTPGDVNSRAVPADGVNSPIADFLGTEKNAAETAATLQGGTLQKTSVFDVHFNTNGASPTYEPYAPLLITEFQANPLGTDAPGDGNTTSQDSEWIEIYNPNSFAISNLSDYKVGNAAKRGSGQGMFQFVSGSIPANGSIIVARYKARFLAGHVGFDPSRVFGLDATPAEMTPYTDWGKGDTINLDNGPNLPATTFEEQILLLDGKDDIVDLVNYGNPPTPYPGNTPINLPEIPDNGGSYERCPASFDTNDNNADFVHRAFAEETPGVTCTGLEGIDMQIAKVGPRNVRPGGTAQFTISYSNVGRTDEPGGTTVTITDTLPTGLTFTPSAGNATPEPTTIDGNKLIWVLPAPAHGSPLSTITLKTNAAADLGANLPLTNSAEIAAPDELAADRGNNVASWTVNTIGPVDLSVSSNFAGPFPPGTQFTFTINYQNIGQDDATGVIVKDTLPAGITLVSQAADGATFNGGTTGLVSWTVGDLPANASGTILVTARVDSTVTVGTALSNTTTISGDNTEANLANNTETRSLTVDFRKLYLSLVVL